MSRPDEPEHDDAEIEAVYDEERRLMWEVYPYPGDEPAEPDDDK